jgi:hypothetical protein
MRALPQIGSGNRVGGRPYGNPLLAPATWLWPARVSPHVNTCLLLGDSAPSKHPPDRRTEHVLWLPGLNNVGF